MEVVSDNFDVKTDKSEKIETEPKEITMEEVEVMEEIRPRKPFLCDICSVGFTLHYNLSKHNRRYHGHTKKKTQGKSSRPKTRTKKGPVVIHFEDEPPEFRMKLKNTLQLILDYDSNPKKCLLTITKLKKEMDPSYFLSTKDLVRVIRGCMISQRYRKAIPILEILTTKFDRNRDLIVYKATFQILENLVDDTDGDIVEYFIRHTSIFETINKREIILEYLIYRIRNGQFHVPRDIIQAKLAKVLTLRRHPLIDPLLKAYISLLEFVLWMNEVQSNSNAGEDGNEDFQNLGEKIVSTINEVIDTSGIWDIFVEKVVQILLYQIKPDECTRFLKNYVDKNPGHLHAHVYLEQHLKNQTMDAVQRQESLKNIADISPSDPLVLDYVDILLQENKINTALEHLFFFVDYGINKDYSLGWLKLFQISWKVYQENDEEGVTTLEALWAERENYWPQYHYDTGFVCIQSKEEAKLCTDKCAFLCIVMKSQDHRYIEVVLQQLEARFPKQFRRLKKILKQSLALL